MRPIPLFACSILLAHALPARAQAPASHHSATAPGLAAADSLEDIRAGRRARNTSLIGTLAPLAALPYVVAPDGRTSGGAMLLASSGIYFGPALGYWMEGAPGRGWQGVGIRLGGMVAAGMLTAAFLVRSDSDYDAMSSSASFVMLGATAGLAWSVVHDINAADRTVRRARAERRARMVQRATRVTLAPRVDPAGHRAGVMGRITF